MGRSGQILDALQVGDRAEIAGAGIGRSIAPGLEPAPSQINEHGTPKVGKIGGVDPAAADQNVQPTRVGQQIVAARAVQPVVTGIAVDEIGNGRADHIFEAAKLGDCAGKA